MVDLVFWFVVGVTIASAVMVVQSKQLLYSAIALLFTFVGVAGLYIFLWADFIAAVQVVVYVGGILVLIVFGIMLTNKITSVNISHTSVQRGIGATVVLGILAGIGFMIINTPWYQVAATEPAQTTETIGRLLMMDYLLPFENLVGKYEDLIVRKIRGTGSGLLKEIVVDLDSLDSIRCFFAILFLARDQKVELDQIDDDIRVTLISDVIKREKNEENSK